MAKNELRLSKQIISLLKRAIDLGLTTPSGGNISLKISRDEVLITPSGLDKYLLKENQLSHLTINGQHLSGPPATSEVPFHLALMKFTDIACVLHLHAPYLSALSTYPDQVINHFFCKPLPRITVIPYDEPGSIQQAESINMGAKMGYRLFLLKNHGMVIATQSPKEAINLMYLLDELTYLALTTSLEQAPVLSFPKELQLEETEQSPISTKFLQRAIKYKLLLPYLSSWHHKKQIKNHHQWYCFDSYAEVRINEIGENKESIQTELKHWSEELFKNSRYINSISFCHPHNLTAFLLSGNRHLFDYIAETVIILKQLIEVDRLPSEQSDEFKKIAAGEVSLVLWKGKGVIVTGKSQSELLDRILVAENSAKIAIITNNATEVDRLSNESKMKLIARYK